MARGMMKAFCNGEDAMLDRAESHRCIVAADEAREKDIEARRRQIMATVTRGKFCIATAVYGVDRFEPFVEEVRDVQSARNLITDETEYTLVLSAEMVRLFGREFAILVDIFEDGSPSFVIRGGDDDRRVNVVGRDQSQSVAEWIAARMNVKHGVIQGEVAR